MKLILTLAVLLIFPLGNMVNAQSIVTPSNLPGSWEGPLVVNRNELLLELTISNEQGSLQAKLISDGLGVFGLPADSFTVDGLSIKATFSRLDAEVTGRIRLNDGKDQAIRIDANWFQGAEMVPIVLLPKTSSGF